MSGPAPDPGGRARTPGRSLRGLPIQGLALLVMLTFAWGLAWPAMKLIVAEIPVFTFRALCAVLAGAAIFAACRGLGLPLALARGDRGRMLLAALFNVFGWFYFSALGLTMIGAGRASIIAYSMPVWAFLIGIPLLNERPDRQRLLGLAFGMAGIAILMGDDLFRLRATPAGALAMLGAAVCFGTGAVVHKRFRWNTPTLTLLGWQLAAAAVPLAVAALAVDLRHLQPTSWVAPAALVYIVIVTAFGMFAWFRVVELLPMGVASIGTLMVPLVGVFSSALALGEPVGWQEISALLLVMAGIATVLKLPGFGGRAESG